ncbi:DNA alkylation repair protein [Candidatus Uhrbacteria bacterium]|nr:DNA alkylation repair protein [Candidatus Uhrbacteria bacterium]
MSQATPPARERGKNPLREVETRVRKLPVDAPYKAFFRSATGTKLKFLAVRMPNLNQLVHEGFSFYKKTDREILKDWDQVWNQTTLHDVMSLPLIYYRWKSSTLTSADFYVCKRWMERVENWAHADQLCQLLSILYEKNPKLVEPTLRQWNHSKNPWKRRASVVCTIYYASKKRTPPSRKVVLFLIEPLLQDKDHYVQKGVGWQLREAYKLWPREILSFLESHVLELPAITFSYATEKLTKIDKNRLKEARRESRR